MLLVISGAGSLDKAADYVLTQTAKEAPYEVILLFVVDSEVPASVSSWLIYVGFMGDKPSEDYRHTILKEYRRRAQEDLDELRDKLEVSGRPCRTRLEEGNLADTLRRVAVEEQADQMVLALPDKSEVGAALYHEAAKELRKDPPCAIKIL